MGKIFIMYIALGVLVLFKVLTLVNLVSRVKKAGKGNWTFRVSWKDVVVIGVKYLLLLAGIWFVAYIVFDTFHESVIELKSIIKSIELKYWLPYIAVVLSDMIDLIDSSIVTKEVEEEAEEKNP